MKVRWTKQSIRLRITPSELERLRQNRSVTENLYLPGGIWSIVVQVSGTITTVGYDQGTLTLFLAETDRDNLAAPDTEGIYFQREEEPSLNYYIEKDFPCLHPRPGEAQEQPSETFAATYHVVNQKMPAPS